MDNVLIVELRNFTKYIFQHPFCHCDGEALLSETEKMTFEVPENKHGLLRDRVFDEADIASFTP
jgi:hypothetical protein